MECIKTTIIGLSDVDCECFDAGKPDDFNTSDSGQFITDVVNINNVEDLADCSTGSLWDIMDKSRNQGIFQFNRNYKRILGEHFQKSVKDCKDAQAGDDKMYGTINNTSNAWIGMEIDSKNISGTFLNITNINTFFTETGTIELHIYSNYSSDPIESITLNTFANKKATNIVDVTLPLFESDCNDLKYYFVYEVDGTNKPKDNKCSCNCMGKRCYQDYYGVRGVEYDSFPDNFENVTKNTNSCNGIKLVMTAYCEEKSVLCPVDLNSDLGQITATIVNNESALVLVNKMLDGNSFGYDTEKLLRKRKYIVTFLNNLYNDMINELHSTDTGCMVCKSYGKHFTM